MQAGTTIWDIVTKLQIVEGSIRANPVAPVVTALGHEVSAAVPPGPRLGATTLLLNLEYAAAETCFLAAVRRGAHNSRRPELILRHDAVSHRALPASSTAWA